MIESDEAFDNARNLIYEDVSRHIFRAAKLLNGRGIEHAELFSRVLWNREPTGKTTILLDGIPILEIFDTQFSNIGKDRVWTSVCRDIGPGVPPPV